MPFFYLSDDRIGRTFRPAGNDFLAIWYLNTDIIIICFIECFVNITYRGRLFSYEISVTSSGWLYLQFGCLKQIIHLNRGQFLAGVKRCSFTKPASVFIITAYAVVNRDLWSRASCATHSVRLPSRSSAIRRRLNLQHRILMTEVTRILCWRLKIVMTNTLQVILNVA